MKENTPEQRARAAQNLEWDWTPEAVALLTRYERDESEEPTTGEWKAYLDTVLGAAPSLLLDVRRELGGITVDYGNHWLMLGFRTDPVWSEDEGFSFGSTSKGHVLTLDETGCVRDTGALHESARTFLEWEAALRSHLSAGHTEASIHKFRMKPPQDFQSLDRLLEDFCRLERVVLYEPASDTRNRMWWDAGRQIGLQRLDDRAFMWASSTDAEFLARLVRYGERHDF